jgi:hypothetical protein
VRQEQRQRRRRLWQDVAVLLSSLSIVALVAVERLT